MPAELTIVFACGTLLLVTFVAARYLILFEGAMLATGDFSVLDPAGKKSTMAHTHQASRNPPAQTSGYLRGVESMCKEVFPRKAQCPYFQKASISGIKSASSYEGWSREAFHSCLPLESDRIFSEEAVKVSCQKIRNTDAGPGEFLTEKGQANLTVNLHTFINEGWAILPGAVTDQDLIQSIVRDDEFQQLDLQANRGYNMWARHPGVDRIATDGRITSWLQHLTGKRARPFQTLNFKVGTQQHIHSDLIHFSTVPQGFMLAVWVALEDIHEDSGPLLAYPGSHKLPVKYYEDLGISSKYNTCPYAADPELMKPFNCLYNHYERQLQRQVLSKLAAPKKVLIKAGDAFVWSANLLHGGSAVTNPNRTRMSQVTHYFLDEAYQYWIPRQSNISEGQMFPRQGIPAHFMDEPCNLTCYVENYPDLHRYRSDLAGADRHLHKSGLSEGRSCACQPQG